jgi:hypothetical protein
VNSITLKKDVAVSRIKEEDGTFKVRFSDSKQELELFGLEPEAAFLMERISKAALVLAENHGIFSRLEFSHEDGKTPFTTEPIEKEVPLIEEEEEDTLTEEEADIDGQLADADADDVEIDIT